MDHPHPIPYTPAEFLEGIGVANGETGELLEKTAIPLECTKMGRIGDNHVLAPHILPSCRDMDFFPVNRRTSMKFSYDHIARKPDIPEWWGEAQRLGSITSFVLYEVVCRFFNQFKSLGRSLVVVKVHCKPKVVEFWCMPIADVVATYKSSNPENVKLVHTYNPESQCVFWAEQLTCPNKGASKGRRTPSLLLNTEIIAARGAIFAMLGQMTTKDVKQAIESEDKEAQANQAVAMKAKIAKKKRQREAQKAAKADKKAMEAEQSQQERTTIELKAVADAKANRIAAPHLQGFCFKAAKEDADSLLNGGVGKLGFCPDAVDRLFERHNEASDSESSSSTDGEDATR